MENFARELRQQCTRKGSIAQLCKATGINRQQFNKYLAGSMLPGARTMRKICTYLGVNESDLLASTSLGVRAPARASADIDFGTFLSGRADDEGTGKPVDATLPVGFYRACFPVPGRPGLVARWLARISAGPDGAQVHSCRNRFRDAAALGYSHHRITYDGPVAYGNQEAALMGKARAPLRLTGIIFVNLRPVVGCDYFSAMLLTRRADGPVALSGAMQFLGADCTARRAMNGMGVISLDDPAADPVMVELLRSAPATGANWLRTERNLPAAPGGSYLPEAVPSLAV